VTAGTPGQAAYEVREALRAAAARQGALAGTVSALERLADPLPFGDQAKPLPPEAALRRDYAEAALHQAAEDAAQQPQSAPGDELSQLRELLRLNTQLVITLRRISSQQDDSGHPEAAYATGCAATMVEALWPVCNEQCTDTTHHPEPQPAPELDLASDEMRPGELDATLATVPPCDEVSPWGMRCRVIRAHETHRDRDGNMWQPEPQPVPSLTEWVVFWGGESPDECAGWHSSEDEADAEEHREWIVGGGVARRPVTFGPWTVTVPPPPAERGLLGDWDDEELAEFRRWREDRQRAADLQAHAGGMGGPSPEHVGDDAAGVAAEQDREARQHARDMAAEDGDYDDCEASL